MLTQLIRRDLKVYTRVLGSISTRSKALFALITLIAVMGVSAPTVSAQDPRVPLPSDTGRMIRGYTDFSRYVTPGMCDAAVRAIAAGVHRSGDKDTTAAASKYFDTLPTIAVEAGKTCLTRFSLATTPAVHLLGLQQLALSVGDDTLADAVVTRRLTLARTVQDSAQVLAQSVFAHLSALPARFSAAKSTIARLERLGVDAGVETLRAQGKLLGIAGQLFDIPTMKQVASSILTLASNLPAVDRDEMALTIKQAWRAQVVVAEWEAPDSVPTVRTQMAQDLAPLRNGIGVRDFLDGYEQNYDQRVRPMLGQPVQPFVTAATYLNPSASDSALRFGQLPRGTIHLLFLQGEVNSRDRGIIRRLYDKYHTQGLRITLIAGTKGYTQWNKSGVLTPPEESESLQQMVKQMQLPVSLIVEEVERGRLPDGRLSFGMTQWFVRTPVGAAIIDRDGILRMGFLWPSETMLDTYLKRVLAANAPVRTTSQTIKR